MSDEANPQSAAREALLRAIPEAVTEVQKHQGPAQAEAINKLAEAYAWIVYPNNTH